MNLFVCFLSFFMGVIATVAGLTSFALHLQKKSKKDLEDQQELQKHGTKLSKLIYNWNVIYTIKDGQNLAEFADELPLDLVECAKFDKFQMTVPVIGPSKCVAKVKMEVEFKELLDDKEEKPA